MSVRGSSQNLRAEVEWYLELEKKAQVRWRKEMELLESLEPMGKKYPVVRLAESGESGRREAKIEALRPRTETDLFGE